MRHPHADVIIAWAEGKQIQVLVSNDKWEDLVSLYPIWVPSTQYRIAPETIKYRLYSCCIQGQGTKVLCWTSDFARTQKEIETTISFNKWISPEMEIELDV